MNQEGDLVIPAEIDGTPVTQIPERAFVDWKKLTSVTIPEGVVAIEDEAFFGCEGLVSVKIPASLAWMGSHVFGRCPNLRAFDVAPDNPVFVFEDGFLLTRDHKVLVRALRPKGDVVVPAGVEKIYTGAFSGCTEMTSVTLPEGVQTLWPDAFEFCENLTTVTIPRSLTLIDYDVFYGCRKLKTMRVVAGDVDRVKGLFEEWTSAEINIDYDYEIDGTDNVC